MVQPLSHSNFYDFYVESKKIEKKSLITNLLLRFVRLTVSKTSEGSSLFFLSIH